MGILKEISLVNLTTVLPIAALVSADKTDGRQAGIPDDHVRLCGGDYHRIRGGGTGHGSGRASELPDGPGNLRAGRRWYLRHHQPPVQPSRPPADLRQTPKKTVVQTPFIMDGQLLTGNIRQAGREENWVHRALLRRQGYKEEQDVLLALWDGGERLTVFPMKPVRQVETL